MVRWCWVKLSVPWRPANWIIVGHLPTALAAGTGGPCLDVFCHFSVYSLFLHLSERRPDIDCNTVSKERAVKPKTTNQPIIR